MKKSEIKKVVLKIKENENSFKYYFNLDEKGNNDYNAIYVGAYDEKFKQMMQAEVLRVIDMGINEDIKRCGHWTGSYIVVLQHHLHSTRKFYILTLYRGSKIYDFSNTCLKEIPMRDAYRMTNKQLLETHCIRIYKLPNEIEEKAKKVNYWENPIIPE